MSRESKIYMVTSVRWVVKNVQLKNKYPILKDHISVSEVITPQGSELLIYDTVTGSEKRPNRSAFDFLSLATGTKTFQEITQELSKKSGEPFDEIWPNLAVLTETMIEDGLLTVSESPFENPRTPPPSVTLVRRLEHVSFETTRKCNVRCKHCYSASGPPREKELTVSEIKHVIDQLADMGVLVMTFTGGEPFMHPHLFELIEYARKKPLTVVIFTNGTLITPEVVDRLKEVDVYKVNVSIDGPDSQTHDHFRGVKGAFEKTIQGIKLLKKAGITVDASICINKFNYKKGKQILQLLKELKIDNFKVWPVRFSGRPGEEIVVTPEEFRETIKDIREFEFEQGKKEKEEYKYNKSLKNCGIGSDRLVIKSNGVITPCLSFEEDCSLGTIREQPLAAIWNNSELLNTLRLLSVFETEICKDCELALVCKGGCIAEIYRQTGEFTCYDKYACIPFEVTKDDYIYVEDTQSNSISVEIN